MPRSTARPAAVPPVRMADFRRNSRRAMRPASSSAAIPLRRGSVVILVARQLSVDAPVRLLHVLEADVHLAGGRLADLHHRLGYPGGALAPPLTGCFAGPLAIRSGPGLYSRS